MKKETGGYVVEDKLIIDNKYSRHIYYNMKGLNNQGIRIFGSFTVTHFKGFSNFATINLKIFMLFLLKQHTDESSASDNFPPTFSSRSFICMR